jgi:hypothetical protein
MHINLSSWLSTSLLSISIGLSLIFPYPTSLKTRSTSLTHNQISIRTLKCRQISHHGSLGIHKTKASHRHPMVRRLSVHKISRTPHLPQPQRTTSLTNQSLHDGPERTTLPLLDPTLQTQWPRPPTPIVKIKAAQLKEDNSNLYRTHITREGLPIAGASHIGSPTTQEPRLLVHTHHAHPRQTIGIPATLSTIG